MCPRRPDPFRDRTRSAFTLPEMLIALVLSILLLGLASSTVMTLATGSQSLVNYSEMNTQSRFALENLGRHLRSCSEVLKATERVLQIERLDARGNVESCRYTYDPGAQTLTFENLTAGTSRVLLANVKSLDLNYFTLRHGPTTNLLEVKHVQVEAVLERDVLDLKNRNYIISARFMLRNRRVSN